MINNSLLPLISLYGHSASLNEPFFISHVLLCISVFTAVSFPYTIYYEPLYTT